MMSKKDEAVSTERALKLALEALDIVNPKEFSEADPDGKIDRAITALREALAEQPRLLSAAPCDQCGYNGPGYYQPKTHPCVSKHHKALAEQEPVSFLDWYENAHWGNEDFKAGCWRAWDATLAQRTWVGLKDEEIEAEFGFIDELMRHCCYRIEAKLKEKNR